MIEGWKVRAACRIAVEAGTADPQWWFPTGDQTTQAAMARKAKRFCRDCPVRDECLKEYRYEPFGIYAGGRHSQRKRPGWTGDRLERVCVECDLVFLAEPQERSNVCSFHCRVERERKRGRKSWAGARA